MLLYSSVPGIRYPVAENAQKEDGQSLCVGQEQTPCKAKH